MTIIARTRNYCQGLRLILSKNAALQNRRNSRQISNNYKVPLNDGTEIPVIGLGTWQSKPAEVVNAVKCAIQIGYRHLDCAHVYQNEKEIGKGIQEKMQDGTICREDLYVTSKLWNTSHGDCQLVVKGVETTLRNLCLSYLDLYLMHWPLGFKAGSELFPKESDGSIALNKDIHYCSVWKEMERLLTLGLVRTIGVSNFNLQQIETLLCTANVCPAVNQIECHPYLNQVNLSQYCRQKGIKIVAYSPLGAPALNKSGPLEDPIVAYIAKNVGKTPAQVLLRYQIDRGHVVIPKSVTPTRIEQNACIFDFQLCEQEINQLLSLERGKLGRTIAFLEAAHHPEYPFKEMLNSPKQT